MAISNPTDLPNSPTLDGTDISSSTKTLMSYQEALALWKMQIQAIQSYESTLLDAASNAGQIPKSFRMQ
jgi:hypothetical protein